MYPLSINYFKKLTQRAAFRIHPEDVEHLEATLDERMYTPSGGQREGEPITRTVENILRIHHLKLTQKEIIKWKKSGKLWIVSKNQKGMDVTTTVEVAIILFEICEASNHSELLRLKGNLQTHLIDNFNITIETTKIIHY